MRERVTGKTSKRSFSWLRLLLVVVVCYAGWQIVDQQMTLSALGTDMELAEQRLEKARAENEQLKTENDQLNDDEYIEKLAREELGMTRQGEMPYIYADDK